MQLEDAKQILRDNWEDGIDCPCCTKHIKLNKFSLTSVVAVCLIKMEKANRNSKWVEPNGFMHVENYLVEIGSNIKGVVGKGKYWDLVEQAPNDDPRKKHNGYWRLTAKGRLFVNGDIMVEKYAHVFNDMCRRKSGHSITIKQALNNRFDYSELMK